MGKVNFLYLHYSDPEYDKADTDNNRYMYKGWVGTQIQLELYFIK